MHCPVSFLSFLNQGLRETVQVLTADPPPCLRPPPVLGSLSQVLTWSLTGPQAMVYFTHVSVRAGPAYLGLVATADDIPL